MFSAESKMLCLLVVLMKIGQLAGSSGSTCRSGSLDGYAFCCCKEVVIPTLSSTSFVNTAMLSTTSAVFATQAITATPSATNASTATISAAISPTVSVTPSASVSTVTASPIPTPQPAFNDSCFVKVDINYAAYNECYCGYTRRNYVAFNGSHYSDTNRTDYQYSCWKLPKPKLYIGGLFNSKSDVGRRILPAADVAIDEINKDESILPAYDLEILTHNTTKGFISTGSGVLLDYLNKDPKKVALLGPDDDELAKSVAAIAGLPRYKLLQISYGTSAIELALEHDDHYPYFFRTKPQLDLLYNLARVEMLEKFNWKEIALLHSKDSYYSKLNDALRSVIQKKNIPIAVEEEFTNDPTSSLEYIKRNKIHVILGTFSAADTSKVLCEAYKLKMYGPRYVYLFIGSVSLNAIRGCTQAHVTCAARYQFFFQKKDDTSCPGTIKTSFDAKYGEYLNATYFNTTVSPVPAGHEYGSYTYDAIYAIARALHDTDTNKTEHGKFYHDFAYGSDKYGLQIKDKILKYDECGVSGKVIFDPDGNRYFKLNVVQKTFANQKEIGTFDNRANPGGKLNIQPIWPGKEPYKKTEVVSSWRFITKELYIVYCIFASLGIIFAIFCLVVLIWKRKHREIRYSFYLMNIVIIIGCILVYISVFLFGVDSIISPILDVDRICRARLWVFSIGFILAVGGILSKLWIAHDVLSKRLLMRKKKRQGIMFGIVSVLLLVTIIILICWHEVNPLHRVIEYIKTKAEYACDTDIWPDSPFTLDSIAVEQCKCTNEIIWYFVMVIWKAFILLISVTWAYQTRQVFLVTINDTQRCGLCAFIIAACSLVGLIIALTTRLLPDVFFGLLGLIIIGCVTAVLIILFLHKILLVFQTARRKLVSSSATEEEDDKNCFKRCFSRINCCSKNCCCGSKESRNGTKRAGEQKFVVNGIANENSAELARLQRELDMKIIYINKLKQTGRPVATPIWTQTTEQVAYLSDGYDTDRGENGKDGNKKKGKGKRGLKIFNQKLDFSHVQSRTDSNYKTGGGAGNGDVIIMNNQGEKEKEEIGRLQRLLAQRDAELHRLRNGTGKPNEFELQEINESIEKDMKKGLKTKDNGTNVDMIGGEDYNALLKEFNVDGKNVSAQEKPNSDKSNVKIDNRKLDWSQVPSKLATTGAVGKCRTTSTVEESKPKEHYGGKKNRVSPVPGDSPSGDSPSKDAGKDKGVDSPLKNAGKDFNDPKSDATRSDKGKDTPSNVTNSDPGLLNVDVTYNNADRRRSSVKIFSKAADYSHVKSSISLSSSGGKVDSERRGSSVKIVNNPKDYSHVKSKLVVDSTPKPKPEDSGDASPRNKATSDVKILNDPKDYSHVRSKLIPDSTPKPKPEISGDASPKSKPNSDVKILNDPKDYSHVKSKLVPDSTPKPKPEISGDTSPKAKPNSDVKILNDPKDYSHVRSKLVPDSTPKPKPEDSRDTSPKGKPSSDVKILNDPKDYSHVKSKLVPDSTPKPKPEISGDTSPKGKPNSDVKILNDPKDYSHVKSTLGTAGSGAGGPKKSTVKIVNKAVDYSHVKSKLA
eukprot:gene8972-9930_t